MRQFAELVRRDIRLDKPLHRQAVVGVDECLECGAVGTIVDIGACCVVSAWLRAGGLWDVPSPAAALERGSS